MEHSDSEVGDVMRDLQRRLQRELEQSGTDAKRARKDRDKVHDAQTDDVIMHVLRDVTLGSCRRERK